MANFNLYLPLLQQVEGGYQNLKADKGNYNSKGENVGTNYGISARFFEQVYKIVPTIETMKSITKDEAKNLYLDHFWDALNASMIFDQYVANTIVDHQINSGKGSKLAQQVLKNHFGKNIEIDGKIGQNTLNALNSVNPQAFVNVYNQEREKYYKSLNSSFLSSWLTRLKSYSYQNESVFNYKYLTVGLIICIGSFFLFNKLHKIL